MNTHKQTKNQSSDESSIGKKMACHQERRRNNKSREEESNSDSSTGQFAIQYNQTKETKLRQTRVHNNESCILHRNKHTTTRSRKPRKKQSKANNATRPALRPPKEIWSQTKKATPNKDWTTTDNDESTTKDQERMQRSNIRKEHIQNKTKAQTKNATKDNSTNSSTTPIILG